MREGDWGRELELTIPGKLDEGEQTNHVTPLPPKYRTTSHSLGWARLLGDPTNQPGNQSSGYLVR